MLGQILPGSVSVDPAHTKHRLKMAEAVKGNCLHILTQWRQGAAAASLSFSLPVIYEPVVKRVIAA